MTTGEQPARVAACRLLCRMVGECSPAEVRAAAEAASEGQWRTAHAIAATNSLTPLLARALGDRGITLPQCIAADLRREQLQAVAHEEHLRPLRVRALRAVVGLDIPTLVLRGAWLAAHAYPSPALRPSSDLDIAVLRNDLRRAARSLRRAGFLRPSSDLSVDLHSHESAVPGEDYRHVWDLAETCEVDGVQVLAPSPADHLVHICRHAAAHHVMRFGAVRSLCDVMHLVRSVGARLDWDTVTRVADVTRAARSAYVVLWLAREYLGVGVPQTVLASLGPASQQGDMRVAVAQAEMAMAEEPEEGVSLSPVFWNLVGGRAALRAPAAARALAGLMRRPWPYLSAAARLMRGDTHLRQRLDRHRRDQLLADVLRGR